MTQVDDRGRGILSDTDREYLRNPDEYSRQAAHARQSAIRERLRNAVLDLPLIVEHLEREDREDALSSDDSDRAPEDLLPLFVSLLYQHFGSEYHLRRAIEEGVEQVHDMEDDPVKVRASVDLSPDSAAERADLHKENSVENIDDVVAIKAGRNISCAPADAVKRAKEEREHRRQQRREQKERALERAKAWKYQRALEFWERYDLPFEWDVAIKGRRSGLSKGSWGDGRTSRTVEHLYVREEFSEGRLEREADSYLCDDSATLRFDEGVRRQNADGESYPPPVTCQACLDLMERWEAE